MLADNYPDMFEDACRIDESIRAARITDDSVGGRYLHSRRIPLRQSVSPDKAEGRERRLPKACKVQYAFGDSPPREGDNWHNECEGSIATCRL